MNLSKTKTLLTSILIPYGTVLFLNNKIASICIFAIVFINPSVALSGLIAVISTLLFAKLIEFKEVRCLQKFYIYNSLLVGMSIGYIISLSMISVFLIIISSAFTFIISFTLNKLFSVYKIPILSLPFSIVTVFIYLASLKYSALLSNLINSNSMFDINLPFFLSSFFKSLGTIFFLPNNIAGILIFLVILFVSRIMALMAISSFYFGILIQGLLIGSISQTLSNPYAFNYILVGVSLCGIFLLPNIKNLLLSFIAIATTVILVDSIEVLFNYYALPVFTMPFNITVITFIFVLSTINYQGFNYYIKATPEKSLTSYLSNLFRFGTIPIKISPPFLGEWNVYQAFDSQLTHQNEYKYAYDFIKTKEGCSYDNKGLSVSDYYCFSEAITAPINGYIVDCRDDLADNMIGEVDLVNNWGNYIIIKSDLGFFVEISHIMQHSITVKIGDYITEDKIIAKCGNSGYSPQPHIHIQVQELPIIGAFTKEFCFKSYYQNNALVFNQLPKTNENIHSFPINKSIKSRLTFIIDEVFNYQVFKNEKLIEEVRFTTKIDALGELYFVDRHQNKLYFYYDNSQFYFYNYKGKNSYLKHLFILAPRVLFINKNNIKYYDYLPVYLVKNKLHSMLIEFATIFYKNIYKIKSQYTYLDNSILSNYGSVTFSPEIKGFETIQYQNITLKRT